MGAPLAPSALWARRLAFFALPVVTISIVGLRLGLIDPTSALAGFGGGLAIALVSLAFSAVATLVIWREGQRGAGRVVIAVVIAAGLVAYPAALGLRALFLPRINDITTDLTRPPRFDLTLAVRRGFNPSSYPGEAVAARQRQAYPEIQPLLVDLDPDDAFTLALELAREQGWTLHHARAPSDGGAAAGRIEATARSLFLGLPDDIVLRIRPEGERARIDMRSASRFGRHDIGVNAARIRRFLEELRQRALVS